MNIYLKTLLISIFSVLVGTSLGFLISFFPIISAIVFAFIMINLMVYIFLKNNQNK